MPRPPKVLDFDREAPRIARVAGAAKAEEQLSLAEQIPAQEHHLESIKLAEYGYTAECSCGQPLRERADRTQARREWTKHLARTPQGSALARTLRRVGRSANGA